MNKILRLLVIIMILLSIISIKSYSQLLDTLPEYNNIENYPFVKVENLNKENWDIYFNDDLVYENVRFLFLSGDSLQICKGAFKKYIQLKRIDKIVYNSSKRNTGIGIAFGIIIGAVSGYYFGNKIFDKYIPSVKGISLFAGGIIGGTIGGLIGYYSYSSDEYIFTKMSYTEKMLAIRTKIFGLKPYE